MSWRMNVSVLLVLAGCSEARDSLVAEDRAAVAAYERYQAKIAPDSDLRIDVAITEPARRMQPGEVAGLLRRLPRSRYLIPYFVSASVHPGAGVTTTLHPRLEQWGQNGYPASEALATTGPGPVASNALEETAGDLLDAGTGSDSGSGSGSDTCSDATLDGPFSEDIGGGGGSGSGSGSSISSGSVLAFHKLGGVNLLTSRTLPTDPPIAASRLRVTLTTGATREQYQALVLHYDGNQPVIADRVLVGINDELTSTGISQTLQEIGADAWTKNTDGCQSYAYGYGKRVSWTLKNGFGFTVANPYVQASVSASLVCSAYDKPNNGGKGCKVSSYDGSPTADGAGASYCFQNYYVTRDTGSGKDPLKDANGTVIGVDFSLGAAADLVNTSTAKVAVKLEGTAGGKSVGGNGSVSVKFDHPGGSYGGVDVNIDGEVICPDYVKP